jgi:hypothetical protein
VVCDHGSLCAFNARTAHWLTDVFADFLTLLLKSKTGGTWELAVLQILAGKSPKSGRKNSFLPFDTSYKNGGGVIVFKHLRFLASYNAFSTVRSGVR